MSAADGNSKNGEYTLDGVPASSGIAMGSVCLYRKEKPVIRSESIDPSEVSKHLDRFNYAKKIIETELKRLKRKEVDNTTLDIIEAQIEIVNDPDLEKRVRKRIENEHETVDFAIQQVFQDYLEVMNQSDNSIITERAVDVEDIRDRFIQVVNNYSLDTEIEPGTVVVAPDISPREVIQFADYNIQGLVVDRGGKSSHASIIAHSMGIPAVVGVKRASKMLEQGCRIIVDGDEGVVVALPSDSTLKTYQRKIDEQHKKQEHIKEILSRPSLTGDRHSFVLRANIEFAEELENVKRYSAEGIGLLRTESLYLRKEHFADGESQEMFYSEVLEKTGNWPITIRLFDAGGDKLFSIGSKEKNPFLGWRGIRMLLDERDLLRDQLRAILKVAGQYPGRVKILVPMVSVIDEILQVKEELFAVEGELIREGVEVDDKIKLGIMVEVPSVAIQAADFAPHVDFFSIGTNDLTQYTLAVDRGNEMISNLYHQIHPAVWRLIKKTVDASLDAEVEIAVCGEMASYPVAAACLLGMGVGDLSMSPASIPKVKSMLIDHDLEEMKELSNRVLEVNTVADVEQIFNEWRTS